MQFVNGEPDLPFSIYHFHTKSSKVELHRLYQIDEQIVYRISFAISVENVFDGVESLFEFQVFCGSTSSVIYHACSAIPYRYNLSSKRPDCTD